MKDQDAILDDDNNGRRAIVVGVDCEEDSHESTIDGIDKLDFVVGARTREVLSEPRRQRHLLHLDHVAIRVARSCDDVCPHRIF